MDVIQPVCLYCIKLHTLIEKAWFCGGGQCQHIKHKTKQEYKPYKGVLLLLVAELLLNGYYSPAILLLMKYLGTGIWIFIKSHYLLAC